MVSLRSSNVAIVALVTTTLLVTPSEGARGHLHPVTVDTPYGALRGFRTTVGQNHEVDTFLKIPYAAPPTGNLRFHKPETVQPWTGTRDATQMGPMCHQPEAVLPDNRTLDTLIHIPMDEDCLYLNIYAPRTRAGSTPLPVMAYIHGGGYQMGTGNYYNGTYLATKGVIVVTMNYRLDALGFLSTQDAASVGNYGLWDQIEALRWIRHAISAFNGDPDDVTIFGQSAGSGSVSQLIMASPARGLFHKAIMQSGVSMSPWAFTYPDDSPNARDIAVRVARGVGCTAQDSSIMVNCLRGKPAMAIIKAAKQVQDDLGLMVMFTPVVEPTFGQYGLFSAVPQVLLKNGRFSNITTMCGFNHDEFTFTIKDEDNSGVTLEEVKTRMEKDVSQLGSGLPQEEQLLLVTSLMDAYVNTPGITDPYQLRQALSDYLTDLWFAAPSVYTLEESTGFPIAPQYLYRFSYRPDLALGPTWKGVQHGTELYFVFGNPFYDDPLSNVSVSGWTEKDRRMADEVMTLWTNFAKYGDPTKQFVLGDSWQPWSNSDRYFMEINSTLSLKSYRRSPQDTWDSFYNHHLANPLDPVIG